MTRAPILAAISGVPSFELLSTTMTSVVRSDGRSAKTRSIDSASLWVGMMTDTRIFLIDSQPQRHFGLDSHAAAIKHTVITIEKTIGRIKRYLQLTTVMAAKQRARSHKVTRMTAKVSAGRPPGCHANTA